MTTVTREHLAGLELALEATHNHPIIADLIAQASAAPEQEVAGHFSFCHDKKKWIQQKLKGPEFAHLLTPLYTHADPSEVEQLKQNHRVHAARLIDERGRLREQLADSHSAAASLQDLCRFLAASYCELDELRYTTAKLPADQIRDFLIGKWPVIQGTANQMNIKRISGQPYDQVGALQGIIAMLATAQPAECDHQWTDDGGHLLICTECGAQEDRDPKWRDMATAPRDGTMLRLLVEFTEHQTEDADQAPTIGANNFDNDGEDRWQFAGWCWSHDHFTEGKGEPVGWLPMLDEPRRTAGGQDDE